MANYQGEIRLRVKATGQSYYFGYSLDQGQSWMPFVETRADLLLSRGYTGAYMGLYTTSNGESTTDFVDFDWVRYKGIER
jgi:alpha-N-arabinofuranosidase